ncbi:MAG: DMT family transporter [Bacteroidales bacterium]|nr:DMT family transporter [Bacteroidales bacterium]MCF8327124.1 DMT family transporter [Bacteroidales bacterium]
MNKKWIAHLTLFGTSLLFGANYWIAKGLMPDYFQPMQIIFMRVLGAMLLFWFLQLFLPKEKVKTKDLLLIALSSALGVAVNQMMFFEGLNLTTPVDTSIIHSSSPLLVLMFAAILSREKLTLMKITGILIGASGALLLVLYGEEASFNSETFRGDIFILINISAYSMYLVLIKPVMARYKPVTVMKWVFFFGFLCVLPFTVWKLPDIQWAAIDSYAWFSLLYVIIGTTFLAYLLTINALRYVDASIAGFYIYLQPVIAAIIGIWLFDEVLTAHKIIAALLVFTGIYIVNKKTAKSQSKLKVPRDT